MKTLIKIIMLSVSMSALLIAINTSLELNELNEKLDAEKNIKKNNDEMLDIKIEQKLDNPEYLEFDDLKLPQHNYPKENYNEEIRKGN